VEADRHLDVELAVATEALDDADQLLERILAAAQAHREAVDDRRLAAVGDEGRPQHHGVLQVLTASGDDVAHRGDRAVTATPPVEQPPEDAAGVDSRHAAPVDRAGGADQGHRVAIADERVVAYRWVGGHRPDVI